MGVLEGDKSMEHRHRAFAFSSEGETHSHSHGSNSSDLFPQGDGDKVSALWDKISMQPGEKAASGVLEIWDLPGPAFSSLRETKRKGIGFTMMSLRLTRVQGKARRLHARFHLLQQARPPGG